MASIYENTRERERTAEAGRPVSELISDGLRQLSQLLRNEMALARAEVSENVKNAIRGSIMLVVAGVVALPALFILMMALAAFLAEMGLAASLAYLITAVIGFVIAGVLAMIGMNRLKAERLVPNRTINQLHRDVTTMKAHM
jgi:Fe2+ transport system protein B